MKPCPFCAEPIQDAAIKCRHCGSVLIPMDQVPQGPGGPPLGAPEGGDEAAQDVKVPWLWLGLAAGALILGAVALALLMRPEPEPAETLAIVPPPVEPYRFSGIAWGTPANEVAAQLASQGFRFTEEDEEGDHVFQGTVEGRDAVVIAMLARGALAKTIVVIVGRGDGERVFAETNRRLADRYGEPKLQAGNGERPIARWPAHADATGDTLLWSTITDQGDVAVHYESALWPEEAQRRRSESATRAAPAQLTT